jgi:hypothetical protein
MRDRELKKVSCGRFSLGTLLGAAMLLSACSTEGFNEAVGLSKSSPDETQVTTSQPLALPPDYSLPPPQEPRNIAEEEPAPVPAAQVQTASVAQPTQIGTGESQQGTTAGAHQEPAISTVNPDGTPKTQRQIYEEARAKKIAQRKAQNESYGTWRNLGSLWSVIWN